MVRTFVSLATQTKGRSPKQPPSGRRSRTAALRLHPTELVQGRQHQNAIPSWITVVDGNNSCTAGGRCGRGRLSDRGAAVRGLAGVTRGSGARVRHRNVPCAASPGPIRKLHSLSFAQRHRARYRSDQHSRCLPARAAQGSRRLAPASSPIRRRTGARPPGPERPHCAQLTSGLGMRAGSPRAAVQRRPDRTPATG